jgi:hypothetical protein
MPLHVTLSLQMLLRLRFLHSHLARMHAQPYITANWCYGPVPKARHKGE